MQEAAPELPPVDTTILAKLQTLGEIVGHMQDAKVPIAAAAAVPDPSNPQDPKIPKTPRSQDALGRFVLTCEEQPASGLAMKGLLTGGRIAVTSDGTELAESLASALRDRGVAAQAVDDMPSDELGGLIFLGGLRQVDSTDQAIAVNREAFAAAQAFATAHSGDGLFVTVQDTGGAFATTAIAPERAWLAGLAGLARTVAQEWPGLSVKAIDLERADRDAGQLAATIADELLLGGPNLDVGLPSDGRRLVLRSRAVEVRTGHAALSDGDVVVASGGARGVTAATLIELAGEAKLRFVLLGRTRLAEEPVGCQDAAGDADLKRVLMQQALDRNEKLSPADLARTVRGILAGREIRATLEAIEARGSEARYLAVDVTDSDALVAALDGVRRDWGAVAGIVHGAGVIHDKLLAEKTPEQFNRVFDTKVEGLRALLEATSDDPLKVLCLFSSVAARCGNLGQCDYAMANEVLNKVAWSEARRRGPDCRVKSLGWGPWEGGMVTPQLQAHFETLGIPLIPLQVGARMLVDELNSAQTDQVEMVLGGEPRALALTQDGKDRTLTVEVIVDRKSHPYLEDHSIQGTPAVPVAFVIEWFSRAAGAFRPDLLLVGLEDLKVLRGISLGNFERERTRLQVHSRQVTNGEAMVVGLELRDAADTVYYRATAHMARERLAPRLDTETNLGLESWGNRTVYDGEVLFHGPEFQMIRSINGISDLGLTAEMRGVIEAGWPAPWCTDPVAFDGGLQLALLWCRRMLGGASLPTAIEVVRTFTDSPIAGPLRCTLTGRKARGSRAVSDVVFHGPDGSVVAELQGIETHLLPRA
jgi:hypothetical protein